MKKRNQLTVVALAMLSFLPAAVQAQSPAPAGTYTNPVLKRDFPDPSVIYGKDRYFYAYSTDGGGQRTPIYKSRNLTKWRPAGVGFTEASRPKFVAGGDTWAPEIAYVGGQYVMYYSLSTWGGEWTCGIGVATSPTPNDAFTDRGKLFISSEIGVQNSIDPCHFTDVDGRQYLFWGSFRGIYGIELSADGLRIKDGAEKFQVAPRNTIEATMMFYHDGYYYLMGSAGSCCEGARSTYHVVVARSRTLRGPYLNKAGRQIMYSAFETILSKSDKVYGPGHNSEIVKDDNGRYWMLYHGFQANDVDAGRVLFLDQVKWDANGWPYIESGQPSATAEAPVFTTYEAAGIGNVNAGADDEPTITLGGRNYFQISAPEGREFTWMVTDLSGRTVEQGTASHVKDLWINDLSNGVYIISAVQGGRKASRKVVKCE